jgi:hypothetical protein
MRRPKPSRLLRGPIYAATLAMLMTGIAALGAADTGEPTSPAPPRPQTPPAGSFAGMPTTPGIVVETMDAAGYTYLLVDAGRGELIWAAAPQVAVGVGDSVGVPTGAPMANYHSKTLDRTFDLIYFVPFVRVEGKEMVPGELPVSHPPAPQPQAEKIDLSGIEKAEGGRTVGEIFDGRAELGGRAVTVRGKVVRFTGQVMGKNWIHLQDGTAGTGGADDLVVTTTDQAEVGATVLVEGTITLDMDLGYGYKYDVIVENARVTAE